MPERLLGFIFCRRLLLIAALPWHRCAAQGCLPLEGSGGAGRWAEVKTFLPPKQPHFSSWVFLCDFMKGGSPESL